VINCGFPLQLMALVYLCEFYQLAEVALYWKQVILMNEHQKSRFAKQIYDVMNGTLAGKRIVLFGFAFKKNTEGTSTR
jgi:UDPglucose 6-dehydrogenase